MTKVEKRSDLEECIRIMKTRASYLATLGDAEGATRAQRAVQGFTDQLAELGSATKPQTS